MDKLSYRFQLDECLDWIIQNDFKRVVIQLKLENLEHAPEISQYLKENANKRRLAISDKQSDEPLDLYITQSSTCCVDLLVTQHVSKLDAIIHMGKVCLSKPEIKNQPEQPPVFFAFGNPRSTEEEFSNNCQAIVGEIKSIKESNPSCNICIIYDSSLIDYAIHLETVIASEGLNEYIDIAHLHCPSSNWYTAPRHQSRFISDKGELINFGPYLLPKPIDRYSCAIQIGDSCSIPLTLEGPSKHLKIDLSGKMNVETVNVSRLLNRRMALVGRLKDEEELKFGVLITNPLPDLTIIMQRLETYAKPRKHTLYFISMIQTIDECKIGNFDLCDAFIVINSCTCSTILESLKFNRPIITELEFKLACCFEAEYGRVLWPGSSSHLSVDDMINKRKVSDVTLALVQTRNELLERCSQARANKWFGLEYKASMDLGEGCGESLEVKEGLEGIASSYSSEPLKKLASSAKTSVNSSSDPATDIKIFTNTNNSLPITTTTTTTDVASLGECDGNK